MTREPPIRLLTVPEVQRHLRLGRSKTYELLRTGALASVRIDRARRVRMTDLAAFIDAHTTR